MSQRFQAAALVSSPSYPNAVAWSDENLVAVASGHLVTILNPATPFGPRGLITLSPSKPFPIGVIDRKYLLSPCLLPTCLSREVRPCVRSISWSPIGFAPNAGCLLAVCTTEGRVKVYRMPYCEFSAEWIEVMDISQMLYTYLESVNFEELEPSSSGIADVPSNKASNKDHVRKNIKETAYIDRNAVEIEPKNLKKNNANNVVTATDAKGKHAKQSPEFSTLPLITTEQFASRSAMLASLIVAWSPILCLTTGFEEAFANNLPGHCSLLAVGGKSGRISFWRFDQPLRYTNMNSREPVTASLIGLLQAHDRWITALSWELFVPDASDPQLLLAAGSSNGSVKIWQAHVNEVMKSPGINLLPFCLLKEVVTIDSGIISVLSLVVPLESPGKMLLAIGRGSGSLDVWIADLLSIKFVKAGCFNAHEHIIMGLAWAFGGNCLYSCSQDNTIRSWILHENILSEVPIPSNTPGARSPSDVPIVYDLCFGLAVSPGSLAMAVAHSFDTDMLNPMYEARIQKAAIEFLWIGGQQLDLNFHHDEEFEIEAFPGFSQRELTCWEHNIFWSFKQYEHKNKPLVIWDIVAALLAFRQSVPNYVECTLLKWMRSFFGSKFDVSPAIPSEISKFLSNIPSCRLHILNVIGRRVFLKELMVDQVNSKEQGCKGLDGAEEMQKFWLKLIGDCEKELRERLLCLNFSAILRRDSNFPHEVVGLGRMMQWVACNLGDVKDHLKLLAEEVGKIKKSLRFDIVEERCSFCSAAVPFESAEVAVCQGVKNISGDCQSHKLARCAVSMLVCPISPTWFCICCHRNALHLAPPVFSMPDYPLESSGDSESYIPEESIKPLCPFCGILLHRLQPEFLLCPSPV